MEEETKDGLIKRIFAPTPKKQKFWGRISTAIGTGLATLLALGTVVNPVGITLLTIGATYFLGDALYRGQKTIKIDKDEESNHTEKFSEN